MAIQFKNVVKESNYTKHYSFSDSRDLTGYELRIQLRSKSDSEIVNSIDRLVTDTIESNTKFVVNLTPSDLNLPEGNYVLGAQISNATTQESKESLSYIKIVKQWVY